VLGVETQETDFRGRWSGIYLVSETELPLAFAPREVVFAQGRPVRAGDQFGIGHKP
jgi:hypothetical protein